MGNHSRTLLNTVLAAIFLLLLSMNIAFYYQFQNMLHANNLVMNTKEVISSLNSLQISIQEYQAKLRGYIITGNEDFTMGKEDVVKKIINQFNNIKKLVADNPAQISRLDYLFPILQERINFANKIIEIYKKEGFKAVQAIISTDLGPTQTNQIFNLTSIMQQEEFLLLQTRAKTYSDNIETANDFLKISSFFMITLLIFVFILFNLQHTRQTRSNKNWKIAQNQLNGLINGTNDGIAALDTQYRLIIFNKAFERGFQLIFGQALAVGDDMLKALTHLPEEQKFILSLWKRGLQGQEFTEVHEFGDPKLARRAYEITCSSIRDENGVLIGASQIYRNVSKRLEMESLIRSENHKLSEGFAEIKSYSQAISQLNLLSSTLQSCLSIDETLNPIITFCPKILPHTAGILYLAHPSRNYLDYALEWNNPHTQERVISPNQCWALRRGQIHHFYNSNDSIACDHIKVNENIPPYVCIPLQAQNEVVGLLYLEFIVDKKVEEELVSLINRQEPLINMIGEAIALSLANINLRESLRIRSIRDTLTGLYNRSYLDESLNREIYRAQRQKTTLAVIIMDLDHFKKINDTFGHEAGDLVLVEVGKLLLRLIRQSDIACRYGGEEILLLIFEVNKEEAYKLTELIRDAINKLELIYHGQPIGPVSASFGIATMPENGVKQTQLIEAADKALYESKKTGRNKITMATK